MSTDFKSILFVVIQFLCMGLIAFTGEILPSGILKLALMAGCGLLFFWSLITMKPSRLKATPAPAKNAELLKKGPYRYIRHPMYTAGLVLTLVWVVNDYSPLRLAFWVILATNTYFKLSFEEHLLQARFPEYEDYKRHTKRLVPFLY